MMLRADADHIPAPVRKELFRVATILFEEFEETTKGRCSEHFRAGRVLALVLHRPHAGTDWGEVAPGEAFRLLVIVNYPRLARSDRDWRHVRDRLRRAWELGEITHQVRLDVESLERINAALAEGVPHFISIATQGIAMYQAEGLRLQSPRRMPAMDRIAAGRAEYAHWYARATDFLNGAAFYQRQDNAPMAALLLHQACEHSYQSLLWSLTLHGPRTHALDELRESAEMLVGRLREAWPRETPFERRTFGCIRLAYVEVRYGRRYRISWEELAWAMDRTKILHELVAAHCSMELELPMPASGKLCRAS